MKYTDLNFENAAAANRIFEESIKAGDLLFKPFKNLDAFSSFFKTHKGSGIHQVSVVGESGCAFASGCYVEGEDRAYITLILVRKDRRRQGIGRTMLSYLEDRLRKESGVFKIEIVFFNPKALSWVLPGENGADHPNAPGVDVGSNAYLFFKNCQYRDYAMQNSYYLDLSKYQIPSFIEDTIHKLEKENITFGIYKADNYHGMEETIKRFENPMWDRDFLGEIAKGKNARPILIASHHRKIIGFTGPLDVERSGRGFFAGIGVDREYRGKKISKVLFCKLCISLQQMGADFMTLFTGEQNPARNIYEAAGFKIVRTWADMRKEWKADV